MENNKSFINYTEKIFKRRQRYTLEIVHANFSPSERKETVLFRRSVQESGELLGMPGLVCPCMHLLSDWPLSLKLANVLVKQSAETIDHCMWQRQGVCVCVSGGGEEGRRKDAKKV